MVGLTEEIAAGHGLEVVGRIGAGGMGEVFLARRRGAAGFERQVVIKRLSPKYTGDPQFTEMLVKEANIMVRLAHPNIVQVEDLIFDQDEYLMVMEFVDGFSLRRLIAKTVKSGKQFSLGFVLSVVREIIRAFEYTHSRRDPEGHVRPVVHCDVTPENILISKHGQVKLTDFGIARVAHTTGLTGEGQIRGKFRYVAPEQVEGRKVTAAADVYSIGLVLYELLTLDFARKGQDTVSLVSEAIRSEPLSLPDEPNVSLPGDAYPEIAELLLRITSRVPEERPDAFELADAVERLARDHDLSLAPGVAVAPVIAELVEIQERLAPKMERPLNTRSATEDITRNETGSSRPTQKRAIPKVLVIDDSDLIRELLMRTLARYGFEVASVGGGNDALDWLVDNECDAVLVDLNLPDLDGLELTSLMRANPRTTHLPIILLTSETESARAVTGLGVGADDFVRKGVSEAEIAARIHAVLRRTRRGQ